MTVISGYAQLPAVSSGRVVRIPDFQSVYVSPRHIDIWLPEEYDSTRKYPVLYMHDGQMLFDSSMTWNHQSWDVDEVIGKLIREKTIPPVIVVGVWNGGSWRHSDYFPQKPFEMLTRAEQDTLYASVRPEGEHSFRTGKVNSDNYLRFLIKEVKPMIDKRFGTRKDRSNTFIAGSSMGGLISLYAICEYPGVFGGAACLSTHWPGIFTLEGNPFPDAMRKYLKKNLPSPAKHRIYFDYGTATLDAMYPDLQKLVDGIMISKGYSEKNWITKAFPGEEHSENAWKRRLDIPLNFLLKP